MQEEELDMQNQNNALKMALVQMIEIGKEYFRDKSSSFSTILKLPNGADRMYDDRRLMENVRYNEIASAANALRLLTGREFFLLWEAGKNRKKIIGFGLFEILDGCPCEPIPLGVPTTIHCRYTGQREYDRRINWNKGFDEGKVVRVFEYFNNNNKNPTVTETWLTEEFKTPVLTSTAVWALTYCRESELYGTELCKTETFNLESERIVWRDETKGMCRQKGYMEPLFINSDF
jgi:hypothetical protein